MPQADGDLYQKYQEAHQTITIIGKDRGRTDFTWTTPLVVEIERKLSGEIRKLFVAKVEQNKYNDLFLTGYCFSKKAERTFKIDSGDDENIIYAGVRYRPGAFLSFLRKNIVSSE